MNNIKSYRQSLLENVNLNDDQDEKNRELISAIVFSHLRHKIGDLLKRGADPNAKAIIGVGADPTREVIPIQAALERDSPHIVKLLIDAGADVNANIPRKYGFFPFSLLKLAKHYVENNNASDESLKMLLNAGANPLTAFEDAIEFTEFFDDFDWWDPPPEKSDPDFSTAVKRRIRGRDLFGED